MTESAFTTIVTNARSLSECCNSGDSTQVSQYLEHWCQIVAQGDWEIFRKRLQWDGIETARSSPSSVAVAEKKALPDWATTLKDIIETASQWKSDSRQPQLLIANDTLPLSINPENPLPFEDLLLPLVHVARQKLLAHVGLPTGNLILKLLLPEAYLGLERSLLISLANFCDKTLEKEFYNFRPFGYRLLSLMEIKTELEPETTHYQAFVQNLLQDGLLTLFQKYPVLGKLIATRIDFWVESTAEFLQRLKTDISAIQQTFQPEENLATDPLGKVAEIKANLSDPHQRGRCVIGLTFESGLKLIYKPKDLGLDIAYQQLLAWFNQQNAPLAFKTLKVLNRSNYGWVEYVEQLPVEDELAAQRFYQRSGMLLCLFYVLNTTDCHYENLIACGEHLVLIDMETLMHHDARDMEESLEEQLQTSADHLLNESVLRSGLLPCWGFNKDEPAPYDISGLGSIDADAALSDRVLVWKLINTDNMHRAYETVTLPPEKNVPMLNGMPLSPNKYLDEIVAGFRQMYHFLIQHREALLAENSPLASFSGQQVRFVFRATKAYAVILQSLLEPEYLQNGCDRAVELDILSRAFLTCQNQPLAWSILSAEVQAMEQSDIPYFAARSDSDALTVGLKQPLSGYFKAPCYEQVISRLLKLEETDLMRQVAIIRGSFYARAARPLDLEAKTAEEPRSNITPVFETSHLFLAAAYDIAAKICSHAIEDGSGNLSWMGLSYIPTAERFQFQVINEGLYDGKCGVALFLAALESLDGSGKFRHLALGALQSTRQRLRVANRKPTQKRTQNIGIGGASGLGSVIYSLSKISQFLKDDSLLEDALNAASLITAELISTDQQLDIANGVSGAMLGLLSLYDQTANSEVLSKAIACGQHLLSDQVNLLSSPKAWTDVRPLVGFPHGASGVAYALLRLHAVANDRAYLEAVRKGMTNGSLPIDRLSSCHYCAGIDLARLGIESILRTEAIHQDSEAVIDQHHLHTVDHLCGGNFSCIETLLVAAQTLARPGLREVAQDQATRVVSRAAEIGTYQLFANLPNDVFDPSFFHGTAGIGYGLLRLVNPAVPSVLLWE